MHFWLELLVFIHDDDWIVVSGLSIVFLFYDCGGTVMLVTLHDVAYVSGGLCIILIFFGKQISCEGCIHMPMQFASFTSIVW